MPPRIDGADSDDVVESLSVIQNHTIRLPCPARAIPPPQITWYKNGDELIEDDFDRRFRILDDGLELEISGAEVDDAARYTCIARNLAGEVEKMFDVDVYGQSLDPPSSSTFLSSFSYVVKLYDEVIRPPLREILCRAVVGP